MKDRTLYIVWAALYIVCGLLGFIQEPQGLVKALLVLLAAGSFVPGGILLYRGYRSGNKERLRRFCILAGVWLGVTFLLILGNFLSVGASKLTGDFLYALLGLLSAPMYCGQYWIASLFLWACLLMAGLSGLRKLSAR